MTQEQKLVTLPDVELGKIYMKLKSAMELKYKIMDVIYPKYFNPWKQPTTIDMRNIHQENIEKLEAIRKLVEDYKP